MDFRQIIKTLGANPRSRANLHFEKHLNSWVHLLMSDIETAKTAVFYAPMGSLGKEFINIEREAFRMNISG